MSCSFAFVYAWNERALRPPEGEKIRVNMLLRSNKISSRKRFQNHQAKRLKIYEHLKDYYRQVVLPNESALHRVVLPLLSRQVELPY